MRTRVIEGKQPNVLLLTYSFARAEVLTVQMIPKKHVTLEGIEARRPLGCCARREGWVGYKLLLYKIPSSSRIVLLDQSDYRRLDFVR